MDGADKGSGDLQDRWNGCAGRSCGGLAGRIHALVDTQGRPVAPRLTDGQVHDSREAESLLDAMDDGAILPADKDYDSDANRSLARERKAWTDIPPRSNRKGAFAFSGWICRQRSIVERFVNRIKQFRGLATGYDKNPLNFLAAVKLIARRLWCAG